MFTFTCPECKKRFSAKKLQSDRILKCPNCQKRMRVALAEEPADADAVKQDRGRIYGPLLFGVSALAGLLLGGGIYFRSSLFGGRSAPFVPQPEEVAQSNAPNPKEKSHPKRGTQAKGDPAPKADGAPKGGAAAKEDAAPKAELRDMSGDAVYNELLRSCVWIKTDEGWGSGALIDRDEKMVLTNQHVANRRCKDILVIFPIFRNGKLVTERDVYLANLKKKDPENVFPATFVDDQAICDLALIRLKGLPKGVKAIRLSKRKIKPGQSLHTVGGSPRGNEGVWIYTPGSVRQISVNKWSYSDRLPREAEIIASSAPINAGDSGGPLVDNRGCLVGVNAMASAGVLNSGHIHVNEVRRFLEKAYRQQLDKQFNAQSDEEAAGPALAAQIDKWIKGLKAPLADKRKEAANELGRIGPDAQRAVLPLLKIVRTPVEPGSVRRAAAAALNEIGPPSDEHLKQLLSALKDKNSVEARRYAALSLGSLPEEKRKEAIEALKKVLKDQGEDAKVRQKAALALANYGKASSEEANGELVDCLRDDETEVRTAAYNALRAGGIPESVGKAVAKELLEGEKDGKKPTREARYWGVTLLVQKFKEEGLADLLASLDRKENYRDVDYMIYVLQQLRDLQLRDFKLHGAEVGTILSKALDHPKEAVWAEAIDTYLELNGKTFADIVKPEENTVEALIKMCIKYPKLAAKLEEKTGKKGQKDWFKNHIREICSTFFKAEGLSFKSSSKLVEMLRNAVKESDDLARRVAVNCLERIGKDAAEAAPELAEALRSEKEVAIRIEILAALAALGEAGRAELDGSKETQLSEELDKWISDARDDNQEVRILASLVKTSFYPGKPQSSKAYKVLAKALVLKNAPIKLDPIQLRRFGVVTLRTLPTPLLRLSSTEREQLQNQRKRQEELHSREVELHQRAKQALSRGGAVAGEAICGMFKTTFRSLGSEKVEMICDKIHARKCAFQVLAKIGSPLAKSKISREVRTLILWELKKDLEGLEDTRVADAAREAKREIFGK